MNPKVSIILPTYKRPEFLERAINCTLKQDYQDWELIIINDGDKDNENLILDWAEKDTRIKYIQLLENSGCVSIPRNIGILYSSGEYICPLDDDIIMFPNRLSSCVTILDHYQEYMLIHGTQLRQNQITRKYEYINIQNYNPLNGWGIDNNQIMYRRKVYDRVTMKFPRRACDWELMRDIWIQYPNKFWYLEDVVSQYDWHGKNRSLDETTKTKEIFPAKFSNLNFKFSREYNIDWTVK